MEFGFEFTFAIIVIGMVDNVNVRYVCVTIKPFIYRLQEGVYWLILNSTTLSVDRYGHDIME